MKGAVDTYSAVLYGIVVIAVGVSLVVDKSRTIKMLQKSGKSMLNIMPAMLGIIGVIGLLLAVIPPNWLVPLWVARG